MAKNDGLFKKLLVQWNSTGADKVIEDTKEVDKQTKLLKANVASLLYNIKKVSDQTDKFVTAQRLLGTTFGKNTGNVTKYANALSNMTGVAESEVYKQVALFGQTANSLGLAADTAELYSKNLATLSSKLAMVYNIDFANASKALRDAAKGESSTLATLTGIIVKNTSLQDQLYRLGIEREVGSLNNAERAILQYITVSKQMQNTDGATAQAVNSVAWQKQLLSEQVKRLATAFGKVLYPVLQAILPIFNAILMVITNIVNVFASLIGYKGDTAETMQSISSGFDSVGASASGAAKSLNTSLRSFDKLNNIKTPTDTSYSGGGGFSIDPRLQDEFAKMNEEMLNIRNRATEISEKIMKWLGFAKDVNGEWKFSKVTFGSIIGILVGSGGVLWAGNKIFNLIKKIKGAGGIIGSILGKSSSVGGSSSGLNVPSPKNVLKGLFDLVLIISAIESIIWAIGKLQKVEGFNEAVNNGLDNLVNVFTKLGKVVLPLAGLSAIIAGLGTVSSTILPGIGALVAIIIALEGVLFALGELKEKTDIEYFVGQGGEMLIQLGDILGRFAGSIAGGFVGGIIEGVMSTLPTLGTYLSDFANNGADFFNTVKDIDSNALQGVEYTAKAILYMTSSNLLDGLSNWLGFGKTNLEAFGKELANFAPYFVKYAQTIKQGNIDAQLVKDSANAALALAEMAKKLPKEDGWVQKVFGKTKKLSDFGKELAEFGPYFASYANSVKGISSDTITESANAARSLSELANNLPKQGGTWQKLFGEKNLAAFGENLKDFGLYFALYSGFISQVNFDKAKQASDELYRLIGISDYIKSVGISNTLKDWAKNLSSSGDFLNNFFTKTKGNNIGTNFGNGIAQGISSALKNYKFPSIGLQNAIGSYVSTFKIKAYAEGGFPEDGLFMANHNELVGKFSNGKTAVANNEDISKGIEQASFQGMMKALTATGGSKQKVEITAEGDASGLLDFITFKQKQTNRRNGL